MPVLTPELSHAFVTSITLAPPPARPRTRGAIADTPPLELKSTDAQSLVVGSGLIVAAAQVPEQTRADLVNCTLFAQLAATAAVGDATNVTQWYDAYFKTLTALGWAQSDAHFEDYEFKSSGAEAHTAVMKVLAVLLGPGAAALAVRAGDPRSPARDARGQPVAHALRPSEQDGEVGAIPGGDGRDRSQWSAADRARRLRSEGQVQLHAGAVLQVRVELDVVEVCGGARHDLRGAH